MADPALPQDAPQLGAHVHAGPSGGLVNNQYTAGHSLLRRFSVRDGPLNTAGRAVLAGRAVFRCLLLCWVQGLQRLNIGGIDRPHIHTLQRLAADHTVHGGLHPGIEIFIEMVLRQTAQMLPGQLLPQKNVVAVVALHNSADLAGLEGKGGVLELLNKAGGGIDEIARAALPAGVLAVGVRKFGEQRLQVLAGLELGQQVLRLRLLRRGVLLRQGLIGGGILGQQQNVVHVGVAVAGSLVEVAGRIVGQLCQVLIEVLGGNHPHMAVPGEPYLVEALAERLLPARLLCLLGKDLVHSGLVLRGQRHVMGLGHVFQQSVGQCVILRVLPDDVRQRGTLHGLIPLDTAVLIQQLPIDAVGDLIHIELVLQLAALGHQPVEVYIRRNGVALHLQHCLAHVQAGQGGKNAAGGILARGVLLPVLLVLGVFLSVLTSAPHAQRQQKEQGQQAAYGFFHVTFPFHR